MISKVALLAVSVATATAFTAPASSLPSMSAGRRSCSLSRVAMAEKKEEDSALVQRRAVVGGLFSLLLPLALPGEADAAKSGGRVGGGGGFRARSAPRAPVGGGGGFARPSVTVIQTAPSMPFGYGYGGGFGYGFGGFGMSPGTALGLTAIEIAESVVREQRRQAFLQEQLRIQQQLGKDQGQIQALQQQLSETNAKLAELQKAKEAAPAK